MRIQNPDKEISNKIELVEYTTIISNKETNQKMIYTISMTILCRWITKHKSRLLIKLFQNKFSPNIIIISYRNINHLASLKHLISSPSIIPIKSICILKKKKNKLKIFLMENLHFIAKANLKISYTKL